MVTEPTQRASPLSRARPAGGVAAGALVAVVGALMLGEYEFGGWMPFVAGPLYGLVLAEVVAAVAGRSRLWWMAVATAGVSAAGLLWAGWLNSGEGVAPLSDLVWPAMALGALTAAVRLWPRANRAA